MTQTDREDAVAPPATGRRGPAWLGSVAIEARDPWALAVRIVTVAVAAGIALWLVVELRAIVMQVLLAVILASGLLPLVMRLQQVGVPRAAAVLLIYLALILTIVAFGVAVVPGVYHQIEEVVRHAPEYSDRLTLWLRDLQAQYPFLPPLDEQLATQLRNLGAQVGALAQQALVLARLALGIFSGLLSTILVLLITLYLIVDGQRVRAWFLDFFGADRRAQLEAVTDRMGVRMGGWLVGQVTLSVVVGTVSFVGLSLLGVPGATLLAVLAGIGEAIPIIGPIATAVPAIIVAATVEPWKAGAAALLYLGIQQLENNFLVPKIMERAVKLHPLAVVLSLLVGGELMGILGTIVSVPVAAAISVILDEIKQARARQREEAAALDAAEADVGPEGEPVRPRGFPARV